jgi:transcriptional regulator with XRE-family HTH domain
LRQLSELVDQPREELAIEIKDWLDLEKRVVQADVARELLALANHGGGYLLFGFRDQEDGWVPSGDPSYDRRYYSQDLINGISERYADPSFHCDVHSVKSSAGNEHVVIRVPGGHRVPIRSRRGGPEGSRLTKDRYYVRRPGPQSAPIASAQEWEELLRRCVAAQREELVQSFRTIMVALGSEGGAEAVALATGAEARAPEQNLIEWEEAGRNRLRERIARDLPDENPSRYAHGTWTVAYELSEPFEQPSLTELMEILQGVAGHETGWPPWWVPTRDPIRPRPVDGLIECWIVEPGREDVPFQHLENGAHSDFWRADPAGKMFLQRGYQEDGSDQYEPGEALDLTLPVWRPGECLLHAERLAARLGSERVRFMVRWDGLEGRQLVSFNWERDVYPGRVAAQTAVTSIVDVEAARIGETLPEILRELVEPLYAVFDFFRPPDSLYAEELTKMVGASKH